VAVTLAAFTAAQPNPTPFPYAVDTTNRIVDQFGDRINLKIMSSWGFAMRATTTEIPTMLDRLKACGFNAVNFAFCGGVNIQPSDWSAVQFKDVDGNNFFTGTVFQSSLGTAFAKTDLIVSECASRGMVAMMSLFGSYDTTTGIITPFTAASNAQIESFGQTVGSRYANSPNVVWHVEAEQGWSASSTMGRRIDYFAKGLAATRTNYPNLWFVETVAGSSDGSMSSYLNAEGTDPTGYQWLHMCANGMYWYGSDMVPQIETDRANAVGFATRKIAAWDCEPPYAQASQYPSPPSGTAISQVQGVRGRIYCDFLEGFSGINWGHERWWCFDLLGLFPSAVPSDWHDVPDALEVVEASYAWKIVDLFTLDPTWSPTSSFVTTGEGTSTSKAAIGAANHAAVAYFPNNRTIVVDTTIIAGTANVRLRWYDPTAGTFSTIAASEAQNASRSVTMPAARGDGTRDFVLVVDDWNEGPVAVTLGSFTSSASGTVSPPGVTGTVARTLGNFTPAASGTVTPPSFTGTSAATLGSFTPAASGAIGENGTSSTTLGSFVSSTSGTSTPPPITGTSATTLGAFVASASGTAFAPGVNGSSATTLGAFTSSASGTIGEQGTGAPTLGAFVSSASGTSTPPAFTGTSATTLGAFTPAASGTFVPAGSGFGSPTLNPFTSNASGTVNPPAITGTVARTLNPFVPNAAGTSTPPPITGTAVTALSPFVAAATGIRTLPGSDGTAAVTLARFNAAASGTVTVPAFTGSAAVTLGTFVGHAVEIIHPFIRTDDTALTLTKLDTDRTLEALE
jgi:hypothetical protein